MRKITKIDENSFNVDIVENNIVIASATVNKNIIENLTVHKKFRHISFGSKILKCCIQEISKNGYDEVIVEKFDEKSLNFFKKHLFKLDNNKLVLSGLKKEIKEKNQTIRVSLVSLIINICLAILKILTGYLFSLNTIMADGINSATDSISTILAMIGIKISNKTEDESHPFGYGKIESIFNLFIAVLILITTSSVLKSSIDRFIYKKQITFSENVFLIYAISFIFIILKILQYIYVKKYALFYNNDILLTLSKDYLADISLSSTVFIAVLLTIKFSYIFDILLSILISLYIIYQAFKIVYENISILLDVQDQDLIRKVKTLILQKEEIFYVHDLFMIKSGKKIYMYADVRMDKNKSVEKSHEIAENISLSIKKEYPFIKKLTLHVEPIY